MEGFSSRITIQSITDFYHTISLTTEYGGTIFEMPDGSKEFIKGYFCCEVQLPNDGRFEDARVFMEEMKRHNGVHP